MLNTKLIIDVGSNSIKYLVIKDNEILNKGKEDISFYDMINSLSTTDHIISHLMLIFDDIMRSNLSYEPNEIIAYGTASMRMFEGSNIFADRVKEKWGVNLKVLSPLEEAKYSFEVISKNFPDVNDIVSIDIGGGSTEVSLGLKKRYIESVSLPIGSNNVTKIGFVKLQAEKDLRLILDPVSQLCSPPIIILTGGTVDCLHRIDAFSSDKDDYDYFNLTKFKVNFEKNKDLLNDYRQRTTCNAMVIIEYILGDLVGKSNIYLCKEDLRFYFI